jgi:1-aminocyclopropane-1-carboxylate deaminase/D-cysteine desulfhydrase-like pyridoxal-dependent ACC family enzyme
MQADELRRRLDGIPRLTLMECPTPLQFLPNLSAQLGRPIYLKRDDGSGSMIGGNKARALEYLLADALQRSARRVVTFGSLHSNHARVTAAAAQQLGLEAHLFYFDPRPHQLTGNLLSCQQLGAHLHFVPLKRGQGARSLIWTNRLVHLLARLWVGSHYFIPVGGYSVLGGLGYVRAALEVHEQVQQAGLQGAWLVVAAGTGTTLTGLWAGLTLLETPVQLAGIDVGKLWKAFPTAIAHLSEQICAFLGEARTFRQEEVPLLPGDDAEPAYGVPSEVGNAAMEELARLESVPLDPIYTAKAFAGMLKRIRQGQLGTDEPVIFLHTGGIPPTPLQ